MCDEGTQCIRQRIPGSDLSTLPCYRIGKGSVAFVREVEQTIYYEGIDVGTRRADFVVEGKIMVELKALIHLEDVHLAQAKNYVVAYDFPVGLLINFGAISLQYKKVFNTKYQTKDK